MSNKYDTAFYTGVTNNLQKRIHEHKNKLRKGFTNKYAITKLVYAEEYGDIVEAIEREKQIKGGSRKKKIELIVGINPKFEDLDVT